MPGGCVFLFSAAPVFSGSGNSSGAQVTLTGIQSVWFEMAARTVVVLHVHGKKYFDFYKGFF